jgi:predicted AAA+ superfamily ATPase
MPGSELFGRAFEHFIALELKAALDYSKSDSLLQYWRTKTGFEVDFVLGDQIAVEVKSTDFVTEKHLKGLIALREEAKIKDFIVISQDPHERLLQGIRILPWQQALRELWNGDWLP